MSRRSPVAVAVALAAALLGVEPHAASSGPAARSDPPADVARVALIAVELAGDAAPELRRAIARALAGALARAGVVVVPLDQAGARLSAEPELDRCSSTACLERIAELLEVDHMISARVEARGADYRIALELAAARPRPGLVARVERSCEICTVGDLARRTAEATTALLRGDAAGGPAGGPPPATDDAPPVAAARPLATASPTPRDLATGPVRPTTWILAGGAVAALIAGVVLLAVDGDGSCDGGGECARLYDTAAAGWGGLAVGVGLGGAAAWRLRDDLGEERASASATRAVSIAVRF